MIAFDLSETEEATFLKWADEHDKTCKFADPLSCGAIGGRLTFSFTPTGLGPIITVKCACGEEKDVSNYDMW